MMIADHQIAPSDSRQTDHNHIQGTILSCCTIDITFPVMVEMLINCQALVQVQVQAPVPTGPQVE